MSDTYPLLDAPLPPTPDATAEVQQQQLPPVQALEMEEQPRPQINFFDQFDADDDGDDAGLIERARLNAVDSYYRGTIAGAGHLRNLSTLGQENDWPKEIKEEYEGIVADLARYDLMRPWDSTLEGAVSLGAQIAGAVPTPESLLGLPIRGATALGRIGMGALSGSVFNTAVDPAVQALSIEAGVQKEYDPLRTALAAPLGAVIGGGLVGAGEVIRAATVKGIRSVLAAEDPSFRSAADEPTPTTEIAPETPPGAQNMPENIPGTPEQAGTPPSAPSESGPLPQASAEAADIATARESLPDYGPAPGAEPRPDAPAGVFMFDASNLQTDAKRFQYKDNADAEGVTTALRGVTKWDPAKANQLIVWEDTGGQLFVADGHQRSGLARRLLTEGSESEIKIPGILYREADGFTAEDVRSIAAAKNIAEGSGSPIDGAKVLRTRPDLMDGSMPISRTEARQSFELARLSDETFGMVVNEVVPYQHAAVVGRYIPSDPQRQLAAMNALARFEPRNETEATVLVQRVAQAELAKAEAGAQGSMFDFETADTTVGEEMRIIARAINDLRKDRTLFSRVVANAGKIEATGSTIERDAARAVAQDAELFARAITSGAYTPGPLRDALLTAARELKNGDKSLNDATAGFLAAARRAAETDVPGGAGDRGSGAAGEGEAGGGLFAIRTVDRLRKQGTSLIGQREAEGQTRLPGLEPTTLKQQLEIEAQKPLRGGDKDFGPDSLFGDSHQQKDLFAQPTPKDHAVLRVLRGEKPSKDSGGDLAIKAFHGSPHDFVKFSMAKIGTGEGAQAYGHGMYFAENEGTARYYREQLIDNISNTQTPQGAVERALGVSGGDRVAALGSLQGNLRSVQETIKRMGDKTPPVFAARVKEYEDAIKLLKEGYSPGGRMYEVRINADPERFLDWDKPLSEQGEHVRQFFESRPSDAPVYPDTPGQHLPGFISPNMRTATDAMREAGIPGIRYLDQGSRGLGEGTYNYVVFDESLIEIVAKDGKPLQEDQALAARRGGGSLHMERARPSAGIPSQTATGTAVATVPEAPSPPQQAAIRSLQQQAFDFADAIGFPLRQGRVSVRNALGVFKTRSGVVRVKEVPDFEVVAHEAGHAIEKKAGKPLTALTKQFASELGPLDYDPVKARPNEGFAEYIRRFIGNPAHAQQIAPGFAVAFRNFMEANHPDMMRAIDRAGEAYRAYLQAPSVDAVAVVRRSMDENPKGWRAVVAQVREDGFPATIKTVMQNAYTALLDRDAPVARAVREMAGAVKARTGKPLNLKAADNPEVLLRLFARTQQAAVRDMMDGVYPYRSVNPEGPSLSQALTKATGAPSVFGRWDEGKRALFSHYLIARRAAVLWERFDAGHLPNPPVAFSKADATIAMAELERGNSTFREASDLVHEYSRGLLRKAYEGQLIGADLYDRLIREEFYVPFMRDLSDRPLAGGDGAARGTPDRVADVVQRLKGSARDIKDPIESLMMQTFLVNRTVRHNDIIRAFIGLARKAGSEGGRYVEPLAAHEARKYTFDLAAAIERAASERGVPPDDVKVLMGAVTDVFGEDPLVGSFFRMEPAGKRGEPIVFYKEGGELRVARFMAGEEGHALYETVTALPSGLQDLSLQVLSISSTALRAGITTNPVYALTNYIRDQIAVGILRPDYIPFVSGWRGLLSEVRQGEAAKLYGYAGGVSAGASIAPLEQAAKANVDALAKKGYLVNRVSSLHGLLQLASVAEAGTRNSVFDTVYKAKQRQGLSEYEAMIEAAYSAQDVLDFSRWGSKTLAVRALTPFVNATVQGLDKAQRTMITPILRKLRGQEVLASDSPEFHNALLAATKVFAVGGALGAAWAALHHDDEIYQDANPALMGTHFVTSNDGKMIIIPKPFELSIGFTAGEYAYKRLMNDDPRAAEQFAKAAYEVMMPPVPVGANPLIKTTAELLSGHSFFTGRDIVPDRLARLDPALQHTDRTSSLAKTIGGMIGVSPIKVDYAIGGYFGLWGRDLLALSAGVDDRAPAQNYDDWVFFRRFIKDPTRTSAVTTKFWDFMGQTTGKFNQAVNSYDALLKGFQDQEAKDFLAKLPANERAYVTLRSASDEDGKPAFKAEHRRLHPLQRAYDAVTVLNGLRGEMSNDAFKSFETGQPMKLSPTQRRDLLDNVRELAQAEMRNALVIAKEPGYADRPLIDLDVTMAKIKTLSPEVAEEISTRYATARIYPTAAVAKAWSMTKAALLRDGSEADLDDFAADASDDGYEFGAERVKRPSKRRIQIERQPAYQ